MKITISRKIFAVFSILIIFFVISIIFLFQNLIKQAHLEITFDEMRDKTHFVEKYFDSRQGGFRLDEKLFLSEIDELAGIAGLRVTFIDKAGRVLADSQKSDPSEMDNHLYRAEVMEAEREGEGHSIRYSHTIGTDMFYYARSFDEFYLRMAKPMHEMRKHLVEIRETMIYLGFFIIFVSFLVVLYLTSSITRPIEETVNFASRFAAGNYSERIKNYSDSEIGQIQRSLNNMADMLVEKITSLVFEQNKLKVTIENIDDGIAVIDKDKRIIIANRAFDSFFEFSGDTSAGHLFFEIIRNSSLNSKIDYALQNPDSIRFEERFTGGRIYDISLNPVSEEKIFQGILIVLRDITEKKRIEQMKTDLVGNMSHELKTPIAIIKGYLETIADNINDPVLSSGFIEKAIENADRQNSIINDILKLNMIETTNEFMTEDVDIDQLIAGCARILEHRAGLKDVKLILSPGSSGKKVRCSRFLAEEIFFNLIDNAINYNVKGGKVIIESYPEADRLTVNIIDTGIGIPPDLRERIFERFYRVDKSRSRDTGGTGLGLSIVKHAVDLLGWEIKVRSTDSGSVFTVVV